MVAVARSAPGHHICSLKARITLVLLASLGILSCPGGPAARAGSPSASGAPAKAPSAAAPALPIWNPFAALVDPRPRKQRQWDHVAARSGDDCREKLKEAGIRFSVLPDRKEPNKDGCGMPRGVVVKRGPTGITYSPPLTVDCSLALELPAIEAAIQAEAEQHLGSPIRKIGTLGAYACRPVKGRFAGARKGLSEHAFGNAFDIARFETKRGASITILKRYELGEPTTKEGRFLAGVERALRRETGARVLGPWFDASHRDHFHVDRGTPYWR